MYKNKINKCIENYSEKNSIVNFDQIPNIDLYMDQLTTFIEEKLSCYKRSREDKILTKTMINNYTKDNLLPPPEKKKYNQDQIALLILIYHMKSGISINDISIIFDAIEDQNVSVEDIYRSFTALQQIEIDNVENRMKKKLDDINKLTEKHDMSMILMIISLILESNSSRLLAERLIDKLSEEELPAINELPKKHMTKEKELKTVKTRTKNA